MKYTKETELAADVIKWLKTQDWTCYSEVTVSDAHGPVDIVAIKGREVRAIETKLQFSWDLLAQARQHVDYATEVYVATPWVRSQFETSILQDDVCAYLKLNRMSVDGHRIGTKLNKYTNWNANVDYFLDAVRPEQLTVGVAGSKAGTAWTPFKGVAESVATFIRDNPGTTMKRICEIQAVKDYYKKQSLAQSNLRAWLRKGVIKHVRVENLHGKVSYWPMISETEPKI